MRFPGGCLVHGNGIPNLYHWKDTIGPVEQRRQQPNLWSYHQSVGLGYFEYFQFCEDIGAKPMPIVAAGVSCQNSGHTGGTGQQCIPLDRMPAYIQDVLDLVEYANGPVSSVWGSKRAAAGHPAPFGLKYLGVGNEDAITPGFRERFRLIHDALQSKHPEITIIGTSGPAPDGDDFEKGWSFAKELKLPMVDEHYYRPPQWFWQNLARYDTYDRTGPKIYVGEYAAHDDKRRSTLRAALAEAAYLTALERNGDVVAMASYAPLLAKRGHTQWSPNLIYFNNTETFPTISYEVQRLFSIHAGDTYLPATRTPAGTALDFATSAVRDSHTGDLILKIVNGAAIPRPFHINLKGADTIKSPATKTVLSGANADVANEDGQPPAASRGANTSNVPAKSDPP
jgi:alpha-L-arabinofuranosidase